jgi:hypothetical protein
MWDVVVDIAVSLWPSRRERIGEGGDLRTIAVPFGSPEAFTRLLNESGWLADEVIAAGALRQGKPPTALTALTGLVLIEMARRRSKLLPRQFVLAVTTDRVVAFAMRTEGTETTTTIKIRRGELGSWSRDAVRAVDPTRGFLTRGGTLELAGEQVAVTSDDDDSTNALIEALSR